MLVHTGTPRDDGKLGSPLAMIDASRDACARAGRVTIRPFERRQRPFPRGPRARPMQRRRAILERRRAELEARLLRVAGAVAA